MKSRSPKPLLATNFETLIFSTPSLNFPKRFFLRLKELLTFDFL
jgi:hypothetical protein